MVLDELPIWAMVGELRIPNSSAPTENREYLVFTHKRFSIGYNEDRVIEVMMAPTSPPPLSMLAPSRRRRAQHAENRSTPPLPGRSAPLQAPPLHTHNGCRRRGIGR
jgi:hypothetical protein